VQFAWLREVIGPLGWSKPIDADEFGSVLTSGYKSIMGLPTGEVDKEEDETELEVERSLI